jgi:hypothetical protein
MKGNEIKIGQTYLAKVSGRVVPVTVLREFERPQGRAGWRTLWICRSEVTGREVTVRSAQRFRAEVPAGREMERFHLKEKSISG